MKVRFAGALMTVITVAVFSFFTHDSEAIGKTLVAVPRGGMTSVDAPYNPQQHTKFHHPKSQTPQSFAADIVNDQQFSCLKPLWEHESHWNPHDLNRSSGAYGVAQFLDSTWAGTGYHKSSDYHIQVKAGLVYIKHRYGSPCGAWSFWRDNSWY